MRVVSGVGVLAVVVWALAPVAFAQDVPVPAEGAPTEAPAPAEGMPVPRAALDAPEVAADYDRAFELMVAGEYAAAAQLFESVAARTQDPARSAATRELARLARRMDDARRVAGPELHFDDGRVEFIVATTLASFYSGFFLTDAFDVVDFRAQTLMVAGTTAVGFTASLFGTRGRRLPGSMAEAYTLGLWSGLANGLLLGPSLGIDPDAAGPEDGNINENYMTFGLVTMAAGGAAGAYLAHRIEPTRGQVRLAGTLGINGAATMGLMLGIVQPEDISAEAATALIAIGLDLGIGVGVALAPRVNWSTSRTSLVALSEFLGALGGFTFAALVLGDDGGDENEGRIASTSMLVGLWGGFALGSYFTRHMAPDVRFERKPETSASTWQLVPVMGRRASGLAVAGAF